MKYLLFIILAVTLRLSPHPDNFVPIGAIALAGGYYLPKRIGFILPLIIMFISDIFLGFHTTVVFVYLSFFLIGLMGSLIKDHLTLKNILRASLMSSLLFFVITNFGVWLMGNMYPKTWEGLIQCYYMAIPFFRNTLAGDLFYNGIFYTAINFRVSSLKAFTSSKNLPVPPA